MKIWNKLLKWVSTSMVSLSKEQVKVLKTTKLRMLR